jgi:hypothetical protein
VRERHSHSKLAYEFRSEQQDHKHRLRLCYEQYCVRINIWLAQKQKNGQTPEITDRIHIRS